LRTWEIALLSGPSSAANSFSNSCIARVRRFLKIALILSIDGISLAWNSRTNSATASD
jgi:hypothetical protein